MTSLSWKTTAMLERRLGLEPLCVFVSVICLWSAQGGEDEGLCTGDSDRKALKRSDAAEQLDT